MRLSLRILDQYRGIHSSNYEFSPNQLAFVHVPKTGGTSIVRIIPSLIATGVPFCHSFPNHHPISNACPPSSHKYVTVYRHPVDRVWSFWQMALRNDPDNPYRVFSSSLEYFLQNTWPCRNLMTRYLTGHIYKEPDNQSVEQAFINLRNFYFVYDFERLTECHANFLTLLARDYNLNRSIDQLPSIPHLRKSSYLELPDQDRHLIEKYNHLDLALHQLVLKHPLL